MVMLAAGVQSLTDAPLGSGRDYQTVASLDNFATTLRIYVCGRWAVKIT